MTLVKRRYYFKWPDTSTLEIDVDTDGAITGIDTFGSVPPEAFVEALREVFPDLLVA